MSKGRFRCTALCVAAVALSGCSGESKPATTTSRTATSASASPTAPSAGPTPTDVRSNAVQVYLAMWADMVEAAKTSDYGSPRLADHATSQALLLLSDALRQAHENQVVINGTPQFAPQITGVTPQTNPVAVSLLDCLDDTHWLNYRLDGQLQNDTPGGKHRATATVGLLNGRWLVTRLKIEGVGTCT